MKKIFVLGTNQLNYIYLLCKSIRRIDPRFEFASFGLTSFSGKYPDDLKDVMGAVIPRRVNILCFGLSMLKSLGQEMFWRTLLFIVFAELNILKAIHFCFKWNQEQSLFLQSNMKEYDIFHFHYLQYSYLRSIWFVPKGSKIVCSFWGSDLLRTSDSFNHFFVQRALQKADIITTDSVELQQIILAKFGRTLEPKIRIIKLALNTSMFEEIDRLAGQDKRKWRAESGIPEDKVTLMIGHNASRFNNQNLIIAALAKMSHPERVFLLLPFMYGSPPAERDLYRKELNDLLSGSNLTYRFLDEYRQESEMAKLWLMTDVMIHMPQSDALSFAAAECMYAGNVLITGSWLPYSPFSKAGLVYTTLDGFDSLTSFVDELAGNLPAFINPCMGNREQVIKHFFPDTTGREWVKLLNELTRK